MDKCITLTAIALVSGVSMLAGDLTPDIQAKFVKILATSAGSPGKVDCSNAGLNAELGKVGMAHDPGSRVAWASSEGEVKSLKAAGKLVLCGKLEWLAAGGSIAVVEENGKPQIYLHMGNISASKVVLSDAVLKIGKKL
jgi:hypothetical protein